MPILIFSQGANFGHHPLGAAIKSKQYGEITVESETHVKSVKITLNLFAVHSAPLLLSFYM